MSLRFRRSVRLAPGIRVNFGLRGPSLSVGPRGLGVTVGPSGVTRHVGIPGTGLSWQERSPAPWNGSRGGAWNPAPAPAPPPPPRVAPPGKELVHFRMALDEHGWLRLTGMDETPLDENLVERIKREDPDTLHRWLDRTCDEINGELDAARTVHEDAPAPDLDHHVAPEPFATREPGPPAPPVRTFWSRILPWGFAERMRTYERELAAYEAAHAQWLRDRDAHAAEWEARRKRGEEDRLHDLDVMHDLLEEAFASLHWPRETHLRYDIAAARGPVRLEIDLPEIELMPQRWAEVAQRGFKLNLHDRPASELQAAYTAHVHGIVFRAVGIAFATLPAATRVVASGYTQRADKATGRPADTYIISVRVPREEWSRIDFARLRDVDPAAALRRFELRCGENAAGALAAIEPFDD